MAPATIAGAALRARTGRGAGWDRDSIIIAIREWVATYGEPPRAADWNPSSAKWSGQPWRVERYRAGRADGSPWPALNSAKRPFGGSLNAAVRAAGFEPARPGPRRRSDVDPDQAHRTITSPEGRALLAAALAQARAAERRVALLEARLERAGERPAREVRERAADGAALARAEQRAAAVEAKAAAAAGEARQATAEARMDAAEARTAAKRLAAKLERAEATIASLRSERRELKAGRQRLGDELVAAERLLERVRAEAARASEAVASRARTSQAADRRERAPQSAELAAARAAAERERRAALQAELRAARAERELRETVAALRGEARRLTTAELAELRCDGPAGPAVMAQALAALAAARRTNNPARLREALRRVAQAAVAWRERI